MKTINRTRLFQKDYRRIKSNPHHRKNVDALLVPVLDCLKAGEPVPPGYNDHALTGNWVGYRECRLKPDLLLIYRHLADGETVELRRLGSHSTLFRM